MAIALAVVEESPSVPRPAPLGADMADDMHDNTLMPYMSGAIGFFCVLRAKVSWALMSTSSHVPVGLRLA